MARRSRAASLDHADRSSNLCSRCHRPSPDRPNAGDRGASRHHPGQATSFFGRTERPSSRFHSVSGQAGRRCRAPRNRIGQHPGLPGPRPRSPFGTHPASGSMRRRHRGGCLLLTRFRMARIPARAAGPVRQESREFFAWQRPATDLALKLVAPRLAQQFLLAFALGTLGDHLHSRLCAGCTMARLRGSDSSSRTN